MNTSSIQGGSSVQKQHRGPTTAGKGGSQQRQFYNPQGTNYRY